MTKNRKIRILDLWLGSPWRRRHHTDANTQRSLLLSRNERDRFGTLTRWRKQNSVNSRLYYLFDNMIQRHKIKANSKRNYVKALPGEWIDK